jgi:hypothetical protein
VHRGLHYIRDKKREDLYDLERDPKEQENLAAGSRDLQAELEQFRTMSKNLAF